MTDLGQSPDPGQLRASVAWTTDELPRSSYGYPGFGVKLDDWNSD